MTAIIVIIVVALILLIIGIPIMALLLVVLGDKAAQNIQQATYVQSGTMQFVVSGARKKKVVAEKKEHGSQSDSKQQNVIEELEGVTLIRPLVNVLGYRFQKGEGKFVIQVGVPKNPPPPATPREPAQGAASDSTQQNVIEEIESIPVLIEVLDGIVVDIDTPTSATSNGALIDSDTTKALKRKKEEEKGVEEERVPFWPIPHYLRKKFGFYWVSIWYPIRHIHSFEMHRIRLLEQATGDGSEAEHWIEHRGKGMVHYLLWQFPRPIIIKNVEFRGGFTADFVLMTTLQIIMPYRPVFVFQGNFFPQITAAIRATIIDFCRDKDLLSFIQEWKSGYAADFYLRVVSQVNIPSETMDELKQMSKEDRENPEKRIQIKFSSREGRHGRGTILEFGIWVRNAWIHNITPEREMLATIRMKEKARLEGDAGIQKAEKEANARRRQAEGERDGKRIEALGERERLENVLAACGGSVDLAMQYLKIDQRKATPGLGTLVEADAKKTGTVISLPATQGTPAPKSEPTQQS